MATKKKTTKKKATKRKVTKKKTAKRKATKCKTAKRNPKKKTTKKKTTKRKVKRKNSPSTRLEIKYVPNKVEVMSRFAKLEKDAPVNKWTKVDSLGKIQDEIFTF